MSLKERAKRVGEAQTRFAEEVTQIVHRVRYALVLVGATAAGVGQFIPPATTGVAWNMVVGLLGVGLAFAGGFITYRVDKEAPLALDEARIALDEAQIATRDAEAFRRSIIGELTGLKRQDKQTRQLVALSRILREGVEQAIASDTPATSGELQRLLLTAYRPFLACLRADAGERWTLTVYSDQDGTLNSVASCNVDRGEEHLNLRQWHTGEGYVGAAHAIDDEVILPDAQAPAVLAVLNVPKDKRNPADSSRYRSIAAIPIRVTGVGNPWGVVIATSDQLGRFDTNGGDEAATSTEAVRILAGMIALIAAAENRQAAERNAKAAEHVDADASANGRRAKKATTSKAASRTRSPQLSIESK